MAPAFTASSTSACSPEADRISTRTVGSLGHQGGGDLDPVRRGDLQVQHHHPRAYGATARQRLGAGGRGRGHLEAGLGQVPGHALAPHRVVVDDHHRHRRRPRPPRPPCPPRHATDPDGRHVAAPAVHQRRDAPRPTSTCSTTPSQQARPADVRRRPLQPDPGPRGHAVEHRPPRRSPSSDRGGTTPPGAGAWPANASARSRCSQASSCTTAVPVDPQASARSLSGSTRPSTRAGSPAATSTEETVSPAAVPVRTSPPVVHSETAPPRRPRSRRTGSRPPARARRRGARSGCVTQRRLDGACAVAAVGALLLRGRDDARATREPIHAPVCP